MNFTHYPIQVLSDQKRVAHTAAGRFVALAADAIAARGRFVALLSGGQTLRTVYTLLSRPPLASRVDWSRVHLCWSDERCLPPDHIESNYRMAREALLDHVPIPPDHVHRIRGEFPPTEAAEMYETAIARLLGADGRFDLVLLEMGDDGHIAALFAGSPALNERVDEQADERERTVLPIYAHTLSAWCVTLTVPLINAARYILLLAVGVDKALALERLQAGEPLPAGRVHPTDGHLAWLTDPPAVGWRSSDLACPVGDGLTFQSQARGRRFQSLRRAT